MAENSGRLPTRRQVVAGVAGSALATALGAPRMGRAQSGPIRIGIVQTLSGSVAQIGKFHLEGAQAAVKELNQSGGIDGRQVELVVRDTKFSATDTLAALRELSGSGINLIHGEVFSSLVLATLPILDSLEIVNISPSVVAMEATHENFNRRFFRCGMNARMQYRGQAFLMPKVAPTAVRWGGVVSDTAGNRQAWDAFSRGLKSAYQKGGKSVEVNEAILTKPGASDFRSAISLALAQNLDGIEVVLSGGEAVSFYQQASPFGLFDKMKAVADSSLALQAGPSLKKMLPPNFWSGCLWYFDGYKHVPMAQKFQQDILADTKQTEVNSFAATGHTVIMSFASAIRKAKSTETDKVIAALETAPFDSVFGELRYRKEDHQLVVNPGFLHVEPQAAEPGYRIADFVSTPAAEILEPASPGVPYKEE